MEPRVQQEYDAIRALLGDIAKRQDRAEKRAEAADKRMDRWEQRADRADKRRAAWEARTDARMEKHDKQIQASRRLVETGMKVLTRLVVDVRDVKKDLHEMKKTLRLLVETRTNGNGRRKHPPFYSVQ
jgi:DNA repair exonuclease SbcCD ATPase subunit